MSTILPNGDFGVKRLTLAAAYWLRPRRVRDLPHLLGRALRDRIVRPAPVPDASFIQDRPPGFAGLALDLSTDVVLKAMERGFYPQGHWGNLKWWSPPQRAIMDLDDVRIPKRFRRTMRRTDMRVEFDTRFAQVLDGCAAPRHSGLNITWLTPRTKALYRRLHAEGYAHSVEILDGDRLVGGLFGVALGPVFSALSMFHTADNASKLAIISLYHHLAEAGFLAVDHQVMSPWVEALGGTVETRCGYEHLLAAPVRTQARPGRWTAGFTLAETAAWEPAEPDRKAKAHGTSATASPVRRPPSP